MMYTDRESGAPDASVLSCRYTRDGERIGILYDNGDVLVGKGESSSRILSMQLPEDEGKPLCLRWTGNGKRFLIAYEHSVCLYRLDEQRSLYHAFDAHINIVDVDVSPHVYDRETISILTHDTSDGSYGLTLIKRGGASHPTETTSMSIPCTASAVAWSPGLQLLMACGDYIYFASVVRPSLVVGLSTGTVCSVNRGHHDRDRSDQITFQDGVSEPQIFQVSGAILSACACGDKLAVLKRESPASAKGASKDTKGSDTGKCELEIFDSVGSLLLSVPMDYTPTCMAGSDSYVAMCNSQRGCLYELGHALVVNSAAQE
ncbi:hypothetical protein KIPB_008566, partial [Kipferlia bialata]|eukprot:g8566.t1